VLVSVQLRITIHLVPDPIVAAAAAGRALAKQADEEVPQLDPALEQFAAQITGSARKEVGAWFADHLRLRRMRSQLKILRRAQEIATESGFDPQVVKLNLLVPLLEAGSLEEDEGMAERWSALLANAAQPSSGSKIPPSFPEVLRQLAPIEAAILDAVYETVVKHPQNRWPNTGAVGDNIRAHFNLDPVSFEVSVDNLYRLRLCAPPSVAFDFTTDKEARYQTTGTALICLTPYGYAFVTACRSPDGTSVGQHPDVGASSNPTTGARINARDVVLPPSTRDIVG
jgi:hypothetical protein